MGCKMIVFSLFIFLSLKYVKSVSVICYYESWSAYSGTVPENFDANLCTHVMYAFVGMWDNGNIKLNDDNLDVNQGLLYRVTDMKKRNPRLKVLLSVGGATADNTRKFAAISKDPGKRGAFIGSANYFISQYHFNGLDIDWEYPKAEDRANYITLLRELKNAFRPKGWLLTAAVAANPTDGYDVRQMNNYLDIINVMSYDYYGGWSQYTGQNSPLFASSVESSWEKSHLNLAASSVNWVNAGAPKNKLSLGTGFYGRSFTLRDPNQHGLHAPVSGVGTDGGYATYSTICSKYGSWTRVWDNQQKNPYKYQGNQWIGYDDKDSIWAKAAWIKNNGFAGVMIWPINGDDVKGQCGEKQILLKQINRAIK